MPEYMSEDNFPESSFSFHSVGPGEPSSGHKAEGQALSATKPSTSLLVIVVFKTAAQDLIIEGIDCLPL